MKPYFALSILCLSVSVATGQTTRPSAGPTTAPTTAPVNRESSDQMLNDLLRPPPTVEGGTRQELPPDNQVLTDQTSGAGAVKPKAPTVNLLREGTYLVDRVGRLTRSADGTRDEFMFASDGKGMRDPPMVLLPNSKLAAMESADLSSNRDLQFRITGVVTEYRGRNYLLLEKVVVVPDVVQKQF